ncbi:MAG: helicase-associated domain-containing protein [Actinomycetota bacterium]|nr:helicase-associated domain-containing protein [Actinomycetota bacterium]
MALAAALANRSDEQLVALLVARPDVLRPSPPRSLAVLATRLTAWPSLLSCLDDLDRFAHQLLAGLCLLPAPASAEELTTLLGAEAAGVTEDDFAAGIERLVARGLAWVAGDRVHLLDQLRRSIARPAGLGPPLAQLLAGQQRGVVDAMAANLGISAPNGPQARHRPRAKSKPKKAEAVARLAELLGDPATLAEVLSSAPAEARVILDRLEAGASTPVAGSMYWHGQPPRTPLEWLQSRGLVVSVSWNRAELPREVGLALRGGRPFPELAPRPPGLVTEEAGGARAHAGSAAADTLAGIEQICTEWGRSPAALLKAGGLGARELKRAARAADRDQAEIPLLVELSLAAGLVATLAGEVLPTPSLDEWLAMAPADRWLALLRGWLDSDRWPSLAGQIDIRDKAVPALHPGNRASRARDQRADVLAALATVPEDRAVTAASLVSHVLWQAPGRWQTGPAHPSRLVAWVLEEAAALGVTCGGALNAPARALVAGHDAGARAAAHALLPPPATNVILQADLTALAAGALHPEVASELHLAAEVESRGAATVFRFSEASVRRALDAGRSAEGLLQFLDDHATKGVPQPLAYLVSDVGRRHGALRAGGASSYLRSDDPALLARALRSKRAASLGLRQLAPGVAVASAPVDQVLDALRADGLLPAEEGPDGTVVKAQPAPRRAAPAPSVSGGPAPIPSPAEVAEVVARLRAAPVGSAPEPRPSAFPGTQILPFSDERFPDPHDADFRSETGDGFADDPDAVLELLLAAVASGQTVLVGHEDPQTGYEEEVIEVVNMAKEVVYARSSARGALRTIKLRRIEWAQLAGDHELSARP